MGCKQTTEHRFGKGSFHQIGLVRGQFGNVPMNSWLKFLEDTGFDGWEEASWELDLGRCGDDAGAARTITRNEPHTIAVSVNPTVAANVVKGWSVFSVENPTASAARAAPPAQNAGRTARAIATSSRPRTASKAPTARPSIRSGVNW